MALWLNYRPDNDTPPTAAMSLNAEPAAPEEREAQHLPPKSYADAAEEALEPQSHVNGTDGTAGGNAQHDHVETDGPKANGVAVLRIVDTNGHQDDDKKPTTESTQESSKESSIKDQESYEGAGTDETPKSPKAKTHRRKGSRSSLGSVGRTYGVSIKNDLNNAATEAKDEASNATANVQNGAANVANDAKDKATDLKNEVDGTREKVEKEASKKVDDTFLQEKPRLVNGDALTTVKPPKEAEKDNRIDKPLKRRDSELKAGRQAGAGWAKSKYVHAINTEPE
jgi:hypothetical protein